MGIRVGIVEDQPLYREMLESTLEKVPQIIVVDTAATVHEARTKFAPGTIDVALLDIDLPDGNGIALGVSLRRAQPSLGILLLSAHNSMDLILDLPPDVRGRWSYLSKTSSTTVQALTNAILGAAAGKTVLDPILLARMTPRSGTAVARLTDRQYSVLRLIAEGLSNAGIGAKLGITEKSVQNHVNAIYNVLGIDSNGGHNARVTAALQLLEETGLLGR